MKMDDQERGQWEAYERERSDELRNELVERYLPLARCIADKYGRKLPTCIDVDDLYSAAYQGLLDAVPRYSIGRRVRPSTFLSYRIRGAVMDYLRSCDEVSRTVRNRIARIQRWEQVELGRPATQDEVYDHFGFTVSIPITQSCESEATSTDRDRNNTIRDVIPDERAPADYNDCTHLLSGLGRRERLMVLMRFLEEKTMKEIGEDIGISESRVSQMFGSIMQHMRKNATAA